MKKLLLIFCLCFSLQFTFAQTDTTKASAKDTVIIDELTSVQVEAQFPGGPIGWKNYLGENLNADLAQKCIKIPKGQKVAKQTVWVSFRVDKDGNISDVRAENAAEVCSKLAAEAVRVIRNGPKWIPATQNGKKVIYRQRQSITWVLTED